MFSAQCFCHLASMSANGYPPDRAAVDSASEEVSATSDATASRDDDDDAPREDDDATRWRVSVGAPVPVAILLLALVPWMPESPRWLMREPNPRAAEALEVLRKTFGVGVGGGGGAGVLGRAVGARVSVRTRTPP